MPRKKLIKTAKKTVRKGRPVGSVSKINLATLNEKLDILVNLLSVKTNEPISTEPKVQPEWVTKSIQTLGDLFNNLSEAVAKLELRIKALELKKTVVSEHDVGVNSTSSNFNSLNKDINDEEKSSSRKSKISEQSSSEIDEFFQS